MRNEDLRRVNRELGELGRELALHPENSERLQRDLQNKLDELYGLATASATQQRITRYGKKGHRRWGEPPRSAA